MPLPNWPKKYLLVQVPSATDPDALAMGQLYCEAPGAGMQSFFDKTYRQYHTSPIFGIDDELKGSSWVPRMDSTIELQLAVTTIQDEFANNPVVIPDVLTRIAGLAEWLHDDIGLIKVGTVSQTAEAIPLVESVIDSWIANYGANRFTDCGHTLDGNGRPNLMTDAEVRAWAKTQVTAQKLRNRSGVPLWEAA